MAKIVGGFLMPHDPLIPSITDAAEPASRDKVLAAFAGINQKIRQLDADTAIIIGDDHYALFGPHCIPRCLIGIGDVDGPAENWLGIAPGPIANNEALATHILHAGFADGIDWSFAKALTVDHAITVPYHYCVRGNPKLRTIPVYLNCGVMPVIQGRRAQQVGQSIGRAVDSWSGAERVVIFGTGGISHWVGAAQMGRINEAFDHRVLDMASRGDVESLIALGDEEILREGGNGALEIRNWICAMSAFGKVKAELITYEPVPQWITGIGFAELKAA